MERSFFLANIMGGGGGHHDGVVVRRSTTKYKYSKQVEGSSQALGSSHYNKEYCGASSTSSITISTTSSSGAQCTVYSVQCTVAVL